MPEIYSATNNEPMIPLVTELEKKGFFRSFMGSVMITPNKTRFESQDDDEKIVLVGRRHFITNIGWIAIVCFGFFVPFFWGEFPFVKVLNDTTNFSLTLLWYAALLFFVIQNFILWFFNVYIVTTERLVDVDFFGLLYKNINVTHIGNVEDINYSQRGLFASIFNMGDVIAQTASEQRTDDKAERSSFTFGMISNPDLVVKIISQLMEIEDEKEHEK